MQRYEHTKVLFFHSSLPYLVISSAHNCLYMCCVSGVTIHLCVCWYHRNYLLLSGARTGAHTSTIDTTWNHVKVHFSAYNWKAQYIFYLSQYMIGAYVRLVLSPYLPHVHSHCEMCSVVRSPCALSCWHSASPCICKATSDHCYCTHHCHIESALPHLYRKCSHSGQSVLP